MTLQVRLVLQALAEVPDQQRYGLEIVESTGLLPGTVYPILARLEQAGWLHSQWEAVDEHAAGRPRRRYYRLTADGVAAVQVARATAAQRRRGPTRMALGWPAAGEGY
ncbi:helix-turn-helix transcriptional regulator [Solwaraspora sp. WMMD792]|uniref:PadR family transcriptional regulator n=1 Tax=Solwaraspora sp. WMMD792 TaxID=3016099 RepID=UPI0024180CEF|nr:helix-turn-helix transcriptional regulator [Solwaraspora sp. WMMD792]MDG4770944.1 helix-turn-helix transcriptional regulator [Solwaraspora sp. WMMD792]